MLLSGVGSYLEETVRPYHGHSIIIEKNTGSLIANSMGIDNFYQLQDGTLKRYNISDIKGFEIPQAYEEYVTNQNAQFLYKGENENYYMNIKEINMGGLGWVIISAIPEDLLLSNVVDNMRMAIALAVVALLISISLYFAITRKLMKPMYNLLHVSEALSSGDLSQRVVVVRNDEIGRISVSLNKVADGIEDIIDNLEDTVDKRTEELYYLSYHDTLTGLYNRQYFDKNRMKLDTVDNLPISVIFADINGLKLTNDIFGHEVGDSLIKKTSEILVQSCRESDLIARIGGDEFVILLPKTDNEKAQKVLDRIRSSFSKAKVAAIKCSVSIGVDTKTSVDQSIGEVFTNAENAMYKDKMMNRKSVNKDIIDTIINTLHAESLAEKQHSEGVSQLCGDIGTELGMTDTEIGKLKRAGYLHDIGKIVLDSNVLTKDNLTKDEMDRVQQHPMVGYRILNLFDDTLDLAEYVYNHHERWDGKGYPKGLKGEEIPLISRIISIAEAYERILRREGKSNPESKEKAIQIMKANAGKRFDPKITELFLQMIQSNN